MLENDIASGPSIRVCLQCLNGCPSLGLLHNKRPSWTDHYD